MRLLLTRPEPDASSLKPQLEAIGCKVILEPLLSVSYDHCNPISLTDVQALIATSRNGLRALEQSPVLEAAHQLPLFVVGKGTMELAKELGFTKLYPGPGRANALPQLIEQSLSPTKGSILHLAGADLAVDLAPALTSLGYTLVKPVVYRAIAAEKFSTATLALFQSGKIDSVLLMSPRTASTYAALVNKSQLTDIASNLSHLCLSEQIAKRLDGIGNTIKETAAKPNWEEMLALIANTVAKKQ